MNTIRVLIVDDDYDWLKTMELFLRNESGISVEATALNSNTAIQIIKNGNIDVVLMDINMTGNENDGIYAASEIFQTYNIKIIMLTSMREDEYILNSFSAGAVSYINKSDYIKIPAAILSLFENNSPIEVLLKDYMRLKEEEVKKDLTSSEKEILQMMSSGYKQKQIQELLFVSRSTIRNHINKLLKKLDVKNTKDAIKKVKMRGIIK